MLDGRTSKSFSLFYADQQMLGTAKELVPFMQSTLRVHCAVTQF
jgi:hypothetical protein